MTHWQSIKFKIWLVAKPVDALGNVAPVCLDVSVFNSEFELNSIPSAMALIPIGRRADDVTKLSRIYALVNDLKIQVPVTVYCKAENLDASTPNDMRSTWPVDEFIIFQGYITGTGYRRTSQSADYTLNMTHWLSDLNFSSSISRHTTPLNANVLFGPAAFGGTSTGIVPPNGPGMVATHQTITFFTDEAVRKDFWGHEAPKPETIFTNATSGAGLKAWLLAISKDDRINSAQITAITEGKVNFDVAKPSQNFEAQAALNRFEPIDGIYSQGVPLRLNALPGISPRLAEAIGQDIGLESQEAYVSATLWDKLCGQFHSNYLFSIVPLVETALVVPFMPGQNTFIHRFISTEDYESAELQTPLPRAIRGVALSVGIKLNAGSAYSKDQSPTVIGPGGWFDKMSVVDDLRFQDGLVIFKDGPRWLQITVPDSRFSARSTGAAGTSDSAATIGVRTVVNVTGGGPRPSNIDSPAQIIEDTRSTCDKFAEALYMFEVLKGRQGSIVGRVRWDIAPGSTVAVEAAEDKFVQEILTPGCPDKPTLYGEVLRVSTVIDANAMRAATAFHLTHIRSEAENNTPGTSIDAHPIWADCRWGGCTLVNHPKFAPNASRFCEAL